MINSIVSQGLIWAILGLGIFMTFRILDFPDMTTEGRVLGGTCDGPSLHKRENTNTLIRDPCDDVL